MKDDEMVPGLNPTGEHVVPAISDPAIPDGAPRSRHRLVSLLLRFRNQLANLTAFTILQAASYLIPVVTIPYFARTLGIAGMGQLAIAGAVALAAGVLMDYAIQLSGTRFAASHAEDHGAINQYLNATLMVKLAILVPIMLGLGMASLSLAQVGAHFWVFFWSLMSAAMICLFPQWLFQGLLIMPLAARILVSCRVVAAVAAMLLVRSPADVYIVPMMQAIGGGIALVATAGMLRRRFGIVIGRPLPGQSQAMLRENWTLFSATAWGAAYSHGAIIIMSTMLSATSIGFYSIAQKISQAFVSMFNVAAQTGFPSFVRSHRSSTSLLGKRVRIYMVIVAASTLSCLSIMLLLRERIYLFFSGVHSDTGVLVFTLALAASFFVIISVSLNPIMVVLQQDRQMARVYRITGLTFLVLAPLACAEYGIVGMATSILITETFIASFFSLSVISRLQRSGI